MKRRLFISYAHEDDDMLKELVSVLEPELLRMNAFYFVDTQMTAGTEYHERLKSECLQSSAVICLVSNAFLNSHYCQSFEVAWAMRRARQLDAAIIPVILESCGWLNTSMRLLRVTPPEGKPVVQYATPREGFAVVVKDIEDALNEDTRLKWMGSGAVTAALAGDRFGFSADSAPAPGLGGLGGAFQQMQDGLSELGDLLPQAGDDGHHAHQHDRDHEDTQHDSHDDGHDVDDDHHDDPDHV